MLSRLVVFLLAIVLMVPVGAAPSVRSSITGTTPNNTQSHILTLPTPIAAGDTILIVLAMDYDAGIITYPDEGNTWITLFNSVNGNVHCSIAWKEAIGNEAGTTITVVSEQYQRGAWGIYSIQDAPLPTVTPPDLGGSLATGTSANPDPGAGTPAGGNQEYLWIASACYGRAGQVISKWPTGYNDNRLDADQDVTAVVATRVATAAAEDPDNWTFSASSDWMASTVAIYPKVSGPSLVIMRRRREGY